MNKFNILTNIAIAGLIAEGEFSTLSKENRLYFPLDYRKINYLQRIIKYNNLSPYISINEKREQAYIHNFDHLSFLQKTWYENGTKIFSKILNPKKINLESIVLCINLFGERKTKTIYIPSSIEKKYINILSYCIEQYINVPVIPGNNHIKITKITDVILSLIPKVSVNHSVELVSILTISEKRKYLKGGKR